MKISLIVPLFFVVLTSHANEAYEEEIKYLFDVILSSECLLNRNGELYTGEEAVDHIGMKFLILRTEISSAESFIKLTASSSRRSGEPYLIQCPEQKSETSGEWLMQKLHQYRRENNE